MSLRAAYWVWRRELHVMLRAPIVYVVGGVFLVVQGVAFAGLVGALSDPRRPAPLGALLEGQLSGTLLTWVLELVVLTLLGMRAIADDKRSGGWELLLTSQVGEGAAVLGKWLAATTVYALLWLPTLAYLGVVAAFRADDGGWDLATIVTGYVGAIAIGAALLAWAIAASAAMASTLGAGALGFSLLIGIFLVGELPALWPDLALDHPTVAAALDLVSVRSTVGGFARGELGLPPVVFTTALALVGLSLAVALACAGRRRRAEVRTRALGTLALAAIGVLAGILAARHPIRLDVSASRRNSLDPETLALLAELPGPATLTIVRPTLGGLDPIYDEVGRVAARMAEAATSVKVITVDPANAPGGLAGIARSAGLAPGDLATGGAVVVDAYGRRRVIDLLAIARIERGPGDAPTVESLAVEQSIGGALAALATTEPITVCATTGHGELPIATTDPASADWRVVADRLRGEGMTVAEVASGDSVTAGCTVVVVAGPVASFTPAEALAIQTYVRSGGALIVAAPSRTLAERGALASTGLEGVLASEGLGLPLAIVVDPSLTVRELPGALLVVNGYSDHAINSGFAGARATLWFQPRAVVATAGASVLISATSQSWGERDLVTAPPRADTDDLAGPVAVAAIGTSKRVIALGSAESLSTAVLASGSSAGDLWLARAIRVLAGKPEPRLAIAARAPEQVRLVMTTGQRRAVTALCVGVIPVVWIVVGAGFVWWRRRRTR